MTPETTTTGDQQPLSDDLTRIFNHVLSNHQLPVSGYHGPAHWIQVLENGRRLAKTTGADLEVVELFAALHDACREDEGADPEHGPRAAEFARGLNGSLFHLSDDRMNTLYTAIHDHTAGTTTDDPTIGTCFDADRLDIGRVGLQVDPRFLCTDAAREIANSELALLAQKKAACELDLRLIDNFWIPHVLESWGKKDISNITMTMSNQATLTFVFDNMRVLQKYGLYEEALLSSYINCRVNWNKWPAHVLKWMFATADRQKLMAAGDPLPHSGPFKVYRGVAGNGAARRIKGISWTASFEKAQFFASRSAKFAGLQNPAVFELTVSVDNVYAFSNGRNEQEFLIDVPENAKPKRIWKGGDE